MDRSPRGSEDLVQNLRGEWVATCVARSVKLMLLTICCNVVEKALHKRIAMGDKGVWLQAVENVV